MINRLRNLWRLSSVELPKAPDHKTLTEKIQKTILGNKQATIVDLQEPIDLFPHEATEQLHPDRA
jgi:hypothetical protein